MTQDHLKVRESYALADQAATEAFGLKLGGCLQAPVVVHLEGDLGAGKSTLARSMLRFWGVEGAIRSPTYTLVESYQTRRGTVHHLDLYRLGDPEELYYLGLDEMLDQDAVWLIEWPAVSEGVLPAPDYRLVLTYDGSGREIQCFSVAGVNF